MFAIPHATAVIPWIERAVAPDARVVRVAALPPSTTSRHLVGVEIPGRGIERVVLKRFHTTPRPGADPAHDPAHEAAVLERLAAVAFPAPRVIAADLEARICDVPALLMTWLPGEATWQPDDRDSYLARTAEVLVAIHSIAWPEPAGLRPYRPYYPQLDLVALPAGADHPLWQRVAVALGRAAPQGDERFIHRDYHPGNVLWNGRRVTGVVDWMEACWGPPGIDLARMRLNLAIAHDEVAAQRFLAAYVHAGGDAAARHPYWDLRDAADLAPDLDAETSADREALSRVEGFAGSALAEL